MTVYVNSTGITVDGVPLNTVAKAVETKTGRIGVSGVRGSNVAIAGRDGSIWTPNKMQEEGRIILPMYVLGCDEDGLVPVGSTALKEFYKNKDLLQRLFSKRHGLLDVRATQPDGSIRQAFCEVQAAVDYQMFSHDDARVAYELVIPDVYWQDLNEITETQAQTITAVGTTFSLFSGGTAPMHDLKIVYELTASGSVTNPWIEDYLTGARVQGIGIADNGFASGKWFINNDVWTSGMVASTTPNTSSPNNIDVLRTGPSQALITIRPDPVTGLVKISSGRSSTSGSPAHTLTLIGRRKYHS